uniref:Radical SAM superfamily enzyme YgiQ, UPF0313 family n=1 Tax=Candidatus Kentrum sp. LFY TaxID=2126342 RepID=A0A450V390_9GAMM|nr:MAG: Radical SAM superfamily enzyme YgiQ, UPF0313 family [Candidatus Kentron sp. LFY]
MKKALIVSFDFMRKGETSPSLAIGSLITHAKADVRYGHEFCIEHVFFNMLDPLDRSLSYFMEKILDKCMQYNTILIAVYIWSECLVVKLIRRLREIGYQGKIVLGGYQITYGREALKHEYPECDIFISSYGENSLVESIFMARPKYPIHLNRQVDFNQLASPYLFGEIDVIFGQRAVRLETKRGCPYRCSFCAHQDLTGNNVYKIKTSRVIEELEWFNSRRVGKINILDPVFNTGNEYLGILEEMVRIKLSSMISLQSRFELIRGKKGDYFIWLVEKLNVVLEFGVQTIVEEECRAINRSIDLGHVRNIFRLLKEKGISYEVSLIYGLPNQTVDSFKKSIDFILESGPKKVVAYPLMLLKGTKLYKQKQKWNLEEKILGDFQIPTVVSGNTFNEDAWLKMHEIANDLEISYTDT